MENNENNNLNELDQLKAQYETLKQQFDQQEIVNDRLMKSAIKNEVDYFSKYRKTVMISYPIMALLLIAFYAWKGMTWPFGLLFLLSPGLIELWFGGLAFLLLLAVVYELWLTRNVRRKVMENSDLLTLSKNMQKLKTGYAIYMGLLFLVGFLLVSLILINSEDKTLNMAEINTRQYYDIILWFSAAGVLLLVFVVMAYCNFVSHCNNVIQHIDAIEGKTTPRWNRSFRIFFCLMVVTLGSGIYIVYDAIHPNIYVRATNDLTTEGKLEIWEIYADTTVSANEAKFLVDWWQQNDSLVVMTNRNQQQEMGFDEGTVQVWKSEDKNQQVKIYALKKTTSQGASVSSAIIGGKPVVRRVDCEPYNKDGTFMSVYMTSEAAQLWGDLTRKADTTGSFRCALSLDGIVCQEWQVMSGIPNGSFFVYKKGTKDDVKAFCKRIVKQ